MLPLENLSSRSMDKRHSMLLKPIVKLERNAKVQARGEEKRKPRRSVQSIREMEGTGEVVVDTSLLRFS